MHLRYFLFFPRIVLARKCFGIVKRNYFLVTLRVKGLTETRCEVLDFYPNLGRETFVVSTIIMSLFS